MRARLVFLFGPVGLVGASIALCLLGATLAVYRPSLQRIGASAESRLGVDYSPERGTPRFARISASIVAAASADEAALAISEPHDTEPAVTLVRPTATRTPDDGDDGRQGDPPLPRPTRTPPPSAPATTPTEGIVVEVPTADVPEGPGTTPTPDPMHTPTPSPTATPTPTATATRTPIPTSTATVVPTSSTTTPTSTATAAPTKPGQPKPTKTPDLTIDPPPQIDVPPLAPLPAPIDLLTAPGGIVGHGGVAGLLVATAQPVARVRRGARSTRASLRIPSSW